MKNKKMVLLRNNRPQKQVAKEIGIPKSTYSMIESGRRFPRKGLQLKFAQYFKTTVDELFFTHYDHETRTIKQKKFFECSSSSTS